MNKTAKGIYQIYISWFGFLPLFQRVALPLIYVAGMVMLICKLYASTKNEPFISQLTFQVY